ncbi:hypothetical protein C2G38_2111252, partial [Gigaspora rosea]
MIIILSKLLELVRKHSGTDILIRNNPAFLNNSKHLPRPAWQQLVVTLERLGCNGNGTSVGRFA